MPLSHMPSILLERVTALLTSMFLHSCSHCLPATSFPRVWTSVGSLKIFFTCPHSFHLLSPSLFLLHIVIRMALKANVTVPLSWLKLPTLLYIQFRIIFKSEHLEMTRTCVGTLVCHLCDLSGYLISLSLLLVRDIGIIIPTSQSRREDKMSYCLSGISTVPGAQRVLRLEHVIVLIPAGVTLGHFQKAFADNPKYCLPPRTLIFCLSTLFISFVEVF